MPKIEDAYYVWMDLEMTGLDPATDKILEIGVAVTDPELNYQFKGNSLVIGWKEKQLKGMSDWAREQHEKSGLLAEVADCYVSQVEAERTLWGFVQAECPDKPRILCGNSIWQDRMFMRLQMPYLESLFHHRMVDVSTVKMVVQSWYPDDPESLFKKADSHRVMPDIHESVEELRYYRSKFFKR